jgi:hypothetical protein
MNRREWLLHCKTDTKQQKLLRTQIKLSKINVERLIKGDCVVNFFLYNGNVFFHSESFKTKSLSKLDILHSKGLPLLIQI